ncbi:MAG: hypothetical protein IPJ74_26125 [Saprospiraceae bacterium]|nr:hypothetical protein [Saprospiraceae bacterium]
MEIRDERMIEIFHTLEKIERINNAIHFHQEQQKPDKLAIDQYQSLKSGLTQQLVELLAKLELNLEIAA